ncbi:hypothetical protein C8R45DRAFT_1097001 [Mycena sanguinolenta]|nr:hypothetical protein C8R45DRAFT_1097001 [Mycena sanguinolenta]
MSAGADAAITRFEGYCGLGRGNKVQDVIAKWFLRNLAGGLGGKAWVETQTYRRDFAYEKGPFCVVSATRKHTGAPSSKNSSLCLGVYTRFHVVHLSKGLMQSRYRSFFSLPPSYLVIIRLILLYLLPSLAVTQIRAGIFESLLKASVIYSPLRRSEPPMQSLSLSSPTSGTFLRERQDARMSVATLIYGSEGCVSVCYFLLFVGVIAPPLSLFSLADVCGTKTCPPAILAVCRCHQVLALAIPSTPLGKRVALTPSACPALPKRCAHAARLAVIGLHRSLGARSTTRDLSDARDSL